MSVEKLFTDLSTVKDFISWCREQKVQGFEAGDLKVTFSPGAFVVPEPEIDPEDVPEEQGVDPSTGFTDEELYPE